MFRARLEQILSSRMQTEKNKTTEFGFLLGKNHFGNDGSQNYLIFEPITDTFTIVTGDTETTIAWTSKELSKEALSLLLH